MICGFFSKQRLASDISLCLCVITVIFGIILPTHQTTSGTDNIPPTRGVQLNYVGRITQHSQILRKNVDTGVVGVMIFINCLLGLVGYWCFEQIPPDDNSIEKPWYFCLSFP
jgi:hypothetical protein